MGTRLLNLLVTTALLLSLVSLVSVIAPADAHARPLKDASRLDSGRRGLRRLSEQERLRMARGSGGASVAAAVAAAAAAATSSSFASPRESSHEGRLLAEAAAGGTAVMKLSSPYVYGRFYTTLTLGTPAREFYVLLDTVSSLSWVYCDCVQCPTSPPVTDPTKPRAFFNSSASATASALACNSSACAAFPMAACGAATALGAAQTYSSAGACEYSTADTAGDVLADVMPLTNAERVTSSPTVAFGCARVSAQAGGSDIFSEVDGALGLGTQPYSLLAQLSAPPANATAAPATVVASSSAGGLVAAVWSLCFDSVANSGVLVLGSMTPPANMVTTAFETAADDSSYYLPVWRMRVGGTEVPGSKTLSRHSGAGQGGSSGGAAFKGGVVIDSDITYTALRSDVFLRVVKMVFADPRLVRQDTGGEVCVFVKASDTSMVLFPPVFLDFAEGSYEVTFNNYLMMNDASEAGATLCLTAYALSNDRVHDAHIGTLWLRDQFIQFNLPNRTVSFAPLNCTSGKPVTAAPQPPPTTSTPIDASASAPTPIPAPATPSATPTAAPPSSRAPAPASTSSPPAAPSSTPPPNKNPSNNTKENRTLPHTGTGTGKPAPGPSPHPAPPSAAAPSLAESEKGPKKTAAAEAPSGASSKGDGKQEPGGKEGVAPSGATGGGLGGKDGEVLGLGVDAGSVEGISSGGGKMVDGNATALSPPPAESKKKSGSPSASAPSRGSLAISVVLSLAVLLLLRQPLHY
ncbi:hypothetical protein CLOM_g23765 [Closterium sp. NIES-68]|nr:hypothetical protein CLOM_g23765 [Closterium sp. NIES-68]GJP70784.1 hypothetical protein CLOP_g1687 [Closterium sp. NIES-67]